MPARTGPLWLRPEAHAVSACAFAAAAFAAAVLLPMSAGPRALLIAFVTACMLMLAFVVQRLRAALARVSDRERRIAGQQALLQSALDSLRHGFSVFDCEGRLTAWNASFERLLKMPAGLTGINLRDILLFQAKRGDFGPIADPDEEARRRFESIYRNLPSRVEHRTMDGRMLAIRRRAMPNGGIVTLYLNITERKSTEEQMELARAQAELANHAKGEFLANMSHELRTPLNAIIGFSEALAGGILGPIADPKQLEYIKDIHDSGLLLLAIINDILDMSKIDAGKLDLVLELVSIPQIIAETLRIVGERARSRDIALVAHQPDGEIVIMADERAIKQLLLNLLSNAIKFSDPGGRVEIRAMRDLAGHFVIEVEDSGIGMTADEIERALQPFGQANSATTRAYGGTGLGLPIAKGLAEAQGGTLTLTSSPGRGTLVRVATPWRPAPSPLIDEVEDDPLATASIAQAD